VYQRGVGNNDPSKCFYRLDDKRKREGKIENSRQAVTEKIRISADMEMLATETVLRQAEMIAEELTRNK